MSKDTPEVTSKTRAARLDASQAERLVISQESAADKISDIFDILNAPGIAWRIANSLLDIAKTMASNDAGQLKYLALVIMGLAAIIQGVAFSGMGFSAGQALQCGADTEEVSGRCIAICD